MISLLDMKDQQTFQSIQIIILDEPTTGLDPIARKVTWDALKKYREDEPSC